VTPGLIPLESFTTFGVNAKPNAATPFGFFGTGLKYAIAVCLRMGQEVVIWRGRDKYTFYVKQMDFRDREFGFVRMKRETWHFLDIVQKSYHKLPFTTELGKTWELWQAFREFETNTRDEDGTTQLEYWEDTSQNAHPDRTVILVYGHKFMDEYYDRHRNFLEEGKTVREDDAVQVLARKSKHIYYRGVRIMDLKRESQYTYNILRHVDLTEDRTAKYPVVVEMWLAEYIAEHKDEQFVRSVAYAPEGSYERHIDYSYVTPSRVGRPFARVARNTPNPTMKELWNKLQPTVPTTVTLHITLPRSSVTDEEIDEITAAVAAIMNLADDELEVVNPAAPSQEDVGVQF
jgi:hypothetical protein